MDSKRAAEVLRDFKSSSSRLMTSCNLGAQALEAWAWVENNGCKLAPAHPPKMWGALSFRDNVRLGHGHTPLAAVLDAMEKEKGNGPE